jgi:hypothetical protein
MVNPEHDSDLMRANLSIIEERLVASPSEPPKSARNVFFYGWETQSIEQLAVICIIKLKYCADRAKCPSWSAPLMTNNRNNHSISFGKVTITGNL